MDPEDQFEWDERKATVNFEKHGFPFEVAALLFDGRAKFERRSRSIRSLEIRFETLAAIENIVLFCAWTWRNGKRRIISLRRANQRERNAYAKGTG